MKQRLTLIIVGMTLATVVSVFNTGYSFQDRESREKRVTNFMRAKLESSQGVLEGLVTSDFEMIDKGAKEMATMSRAADWQVIKGAMYDQYSAEFRRNTEQLRKTAQEKNIDAAAYSYMQVTMSCISCHKFVRSTKIAAGEPVSPGLKIAMSELIAPR